MNKIKKEVKNTPPYASRNIFTVSVLRGVSFLSVLLFHYTYRYGTKEEIVALDLSVDWPFQLEWGRAAIVSFFMISGFLIGGYFHNKNVHSMQYLTNRFFRLFPTFWCGLILTYLSIRLFFPEASCGLQTFLFNFSMIPSFLGYRFVDGAYWTMQVEFFFSLMIGIILLSSNLRIKRCLLLLWVLIICISYFYPYKPVSHKLNIVFSVYYAHMFVAGICSYLILHKDISPYTWMLLIICFVNQFLYSESKYHTIFFFITLIVLMSTRYLDKIFEKEEKSWFMKFISFCARLSYSWYIVHQMIGYVIIKNFVGRGFTTEWIILIPIIVTGCIAYWLNRLVEVPTGKLGKTLSMRLVKKNY